VNEILSRPALFWILVAALFALAEMLVPFFGFIFASAAAVVAAFTAAWAAGWEIQLIVFSVILVFGVLLLRPRIVSRIHRGSKGVPSRTHELVGKKGILTAPVEPDAAHGRVWVEEQDWAAQAEEPLAAGTEVQVEGSDGIVLKVRKV
jgi:membrane protein implicated in regulation of membrane protease activity